MALEAAHHAGRPNQVANLGTLRCFMAYETML